MKCNCTAGLGIFFDEETGECTGSPELAIAHVPMQVWRKLYSQEKALQRGTLFAELDLPFSGGKWK